MGDGDSLDCIQLPINYSSRNDVHLYKNLIYPEALRMKWYHLNIALQKYLVAVFQAIDILVFQLEVQDYNTVAENYRLSERTKGLQEPSFWHITDDDQLELGAHREVQISKISCTHIIQQRNYEDYQDHQEHELLCSRINWMQSIKGCS